MSFETSNGTAMAGEDYESTSGVLAFAPHQVRRLLALSARSELVAYVYCCVPCVVSVKRPSQSPSPMMTKWNRMRTSSAQSVKFHRGLHRRCVGGFGLAVRCLQSFSNTV